MQDKIAKRLEQKKQRLLAKVGQEHQLDLEMIIFVAMALAVAVVEEKRAELQQ